MPWAAWLDAVEGQLREADDRWRSPAARRSAAPRYSTTRRAMLRARCTRHTKFRLSSTFLTVPSSVHSSSAKPTMPTRPAADVLGELHEPVRDLHACIADGAEELQQEGLELAVRAEGLEHREAQCDQRNQRQQRGVDQAGGAQRQLAAEEVANDGVGISQHAQQRAPAGCAPACEARTARGPAVSRTVATWRQASHAGGSARRRSREATQGFGVFLHRLAR